MNYAFVFNHLLGYNYMHSIVGLSRITFSLFNFCYKLYKKNKFDKSRY